MSAVVGDNSMAIDATHHLLFVADYNNNRVLVFTLTSGNAISSKTPTYVLGQSSLVACGGAATTQSGMNGPVYVAVDVSNQRLFVSDQNNNRVLVFNTASLANGMNASNVLGQPDFVTASTATSQSGMNSPEGIAFDATNNRLFVAEYNNNRVLVFNTASITNGMNAANELGQPSGTAFTSNTQATTQSGMQGPNDVAYDATNSRLFVADQANNRVLVFSVSSITNGMNAANELGQPSGTAYTSATAATSRPGMRTPAALAYDSANSRLFVADRDNNRVLVFSVSSITNGQNAANELGQPSGTAYTSSTAATSQSGLTQPDGLTFDATNNKLFIGDSDNNPVMIFDVTSITNGENAVDLLGQYTSTSSTSTVSYTQATADNANIKIGFTRPSGVAMDSVNHRLFVSDSTNHRVLVYNLNTDNSFSDRVPDNVLGHGQRHRRGRSAGPFPAATCCCWWSGK